MDDIDIYTRITTSLLGIAYPILLQVIARLDEKYASTHIVELFRTEKGKKWFERLLIISLLSIFIWSFKFQPLFQYDGLNYVINNSANIVVIISTTALVVVFFRFVRKILIYYTPAKFIQYLFKHHKKHDPDYTYFKALTDIFLHSIQKQNHKLSNEIIEFLRDAFAEVRKRAANEPVEYPAPYYELVNKAVEELAIIRNKKDSNLESLTAGGRWLLGETKNIQISELTYSWLWRNLVLAVQYEQDSMVIYYWEKAHQYFQFQLEAVEPRYSELDNGGFTITNQPEIEQREKERYRFLEFHYVLGGLLMYRKRYSCIQTIFTYTLDIPPKYVLLPETMKEIFTRFFELSDPLQYRQSRLDTRYWFPDQFSITSEEVMQTWVAAYLSVLFLRQYTIAPYLITMAPLEYPPTPTTQGEKKGYIEGLDFFSARISETLQNSRLIEALHFEPLVTDSWYENKEQTPPLSYINQFKESLINAYESAAIDLSLAQEKIGEFYQTSKRIIGDKMEVYSAINNKERITNDFHRSVVNGGYMIMSKDAFSDVPEVDHSGHNSVLANSIATRLEKAIPESFFMRNSYRNYVIDHDNLFQAIDRLQINEEYIIILFGMNIEYYREVLRIKGLSDSNYRGIAYYNYHVSPAHLRSAFILKRSDLPNIITIEPDKELVQEYSLNEIDSELNLYASILDLNTVTDEMRDQLSQNSRLDLKKSALLYLYFTVEIRWKNSIPMIQLIPFSERMRERTPQGMDEIEPIVPTPEQSKEQSE